MKTQRLLWLAVPVLAASLACAAATTTNDVSALLQKGLFEEEANRNLAAAIQAYQAVITQTDRDRQFAATAIFRLGECYRKQGQTNEASLQYSRIVREFSDQTDLVKLSVQQLGSAAPATPGGAPDQAGALTAELHALEALNKDQLRIAVQQEYPNPVLTVLLQQLNSVEQELTKLKSDLGPENPDVVRQQKLRDLLNQQVDQQVRGVLDGLQRKLEVVEKTEAMQRAANSAAAGPKLMDLQSDFSATNQPAPDPEAEEVKRIQALVKDSPDLINAPDPSGRTPLLLAVDQNELEVAKFLLANKADVEARDGSQRTPLGVAAESGSTGLVQLLLADGANPDAAGGRASMRLGGGGGPRDGGGGFGGGRSRSSAATPLILATARGHKSVIEVLLANRANPNAKDSRGDTALAYAADQGFKSIAELLIAKGADVNLANADGKTPLHGACAAGNTSTAELLIAHKADVNAQTLHAEMPLHDAVMNQQMEAARLLIEHGAEVNVQIADGSDMAGRTPLHFAVANGQIQMIQLLLEHGANPNLTAACLDAPTGVGGVMYNGCTPLLLAVVRHEPETAELLLKFKADVNQADDKGNTPLMQAVFKQYPEFIGLLLARGAKTELRNADDQTPLFAAVNRDQTNLAGLLLKGGADANATCKSDGDTALFRAASHGDPATIKLLLDHHAAVNLLDNYGNTPLSVAEQRQGATGQSPEQKVRSAEAVALLKGAGANNDLKRRSYIGLIRNSTGRPEEANVFFKGTNSFNRHSLFELIAQYYGHGGIQSSSYSPGLGGGFYLPAQTQFPFPDLARIRIDRLQAGGGRKEIPVDLAAILKADGYCSHDMWLEWGDVVEIPELDHNINEPWHGLSDELRETLSTCLDRKVEIVVKGETFPVKLEPGFSTYPPGGYFPGRRLKPPNMLTPGNTTTTPAIGTESPETRHLNTFWLAETVSGAAVLRASSDITRVKVKHHDPVTHKTQELSFNLESNKANPDLWLRDGDVIEIPEKP